jgi:hypothetical protein
MIDSNIAIGYLRSLIHCVPTEMRLYEACPESKFQLAVNG